MNETFSLRIVYFDSYLLDLEDSKLFYSKEKLSSSKNIDENFIKIRYSSFMERFIKLTPIIRIFGSTYRGQRCCLNVHNYFPYFYVELDLENMFELSISNLRKFAYLLEELYHRYVKSREAENNYNKKLKQVIHNIEVVKKIPFYGFHLKKQEFLLISVYDHKSIKPLVDILQSKSIFNKHYQCYEAHLSLAIHFFSDYNLYGMQLIKFTNFTFRIDIPETIKFESEDSTDYVKNISWRHVNNNQILIENGNTVNENMYHEELLIWDEFNFELSKKRKSSKCTLEIDVSVEDIINKKNISNDSKEEETFKLNDCSKVTLSNLENHIKYVKPLIEVWKDEIKRRKERKLDELKFEKISNQNFFQPVESLIIKSPEITLQKLKYHISISPLVQQKRLLNNLDLKTFDNNFNELINVDRKFGNFFGIKRHFVFHSKRTNFYNFKNKKEDDIYNEEGEINDILSCINTQTVTNSQRKNIVRSIATNKSMLEYFNSTEASSRSQSQEKDIKISKSQKEVDNFKKRYSLLQKKNKINDNKSLSELVFNQHFNNIFLFKQIYFLWIKRKFLNSIEINPTVKVDKFLYFSKKTDYDSFIKLKDKFQKNKFRLQTNPLFEHHNSLINYLSEYTKIIMKPELTAPDSILNRNKLIEKYRGNMKNSRLDSVPRVILSSKKLIFSMTFPSRKDLSANLQKKKKALLNSYIYDSKIFNKRFNKNVENHEYNRLSVPTRNRVYATNNFIHEISPSTDIKNRSISFDLHTDYSREKLKENTVKKEKELIKNLGEVYNLCIVSVEVSTEIRTNYVFDYEKDPINTIFLVIHDENAQLSLKHSYKRYKLVITTFPNKDISKRFNKSNFIFGPEYFDDIVEIIFVKDEVALFQRFIEVILKYDPDFIIGYETETSSIAAIVRRAEFLKIPMRQYLSKINFPNLNPFRDEYYRNQVKIQQTNSNKLEGGKSNEQIEYKYLEQKFGKRVKIKGRIIINLWRIIEAEIKLTHYQIENVVFKVLKIREPILSKEILFKYFISNYMNENAYMFSYFMKRTEYNIQLIEELDLINRDAQFTQIYGIDYQSSISRGSQYRVESMLCRLSKRLDYVLLSASRFQLKKQIPNQMIPLVMEPPKCFYFSPVVVLDFQSLYPSIMIAYNICYSTCLGKIVNSLEEFNDEYKENDIFKKLGVYKYFKNLRDSLKDLNIQEHIFKDDLLLVDWLKDNINVSPNSIGFLRQHLIEGVIPTVLKEILETRIMIKSSMKKYSNTSTIYKILHNRQLGLKLLANVTYGYTAAGFSGRMPCSEIADSIISLAKETLLLAIKTCEKEFKGKVIYGDTDSIFVLFEGKTISEAFQIGQEIAKKVTERNPQPIKLQFEKVYCPLVMVSKKHYAGYKYETPDPSKKTLDSKGLELIRRDTCEAVTKICEKIVRIIFDTKDLSKVKAFLYKTFDKIITGKAIIKEFIFAKEVRFGTYRSATLPPSAIIAEKKALKDKNSLPRYAERVPYLVIENSRSKALKDQIISPDDFFKTKNVRINSKYYIEKQILPVVQRFLEPLDIDVDDWYMHYPRPKKSKFNLYHNSKRKNIESKNLLHYFQIQGEDKKNKVCNKNLYESSSSASLEKNKENLKHILKSLTSQFNENTRKEYNDICKFCSDFKKFNVFYDIEDPVPCLNTQCKIFYEKMRLSQKSN